MNCSCARPVGGGAFAAPRTPEQVEQASRQAPSTHQHAAQAPVTSTDASTGAETLAKPVVKPAATHQHAAAALPAIGSGITRHENHNLAWASGVPNQIADQAKSMDVYSKLKALAAKYPTADSLKAAGWTETNPGSQHWTAPDPLKAEATLINDGETKFLHMVTKDGRSIGGQFNSNQYDVPPTWGGLWHTHEDKAKESDKLWMAHIYVDRPFEQAFAL